MTYLNELLVEQRVADLQRAGTSVRVVQTAHPGGWRRFARSAASRSLVSLGERVAPPARTPVTR
jgi:hypothetical protein